MTVQFVESELTDEQWDRLYKSILHQLDMDEAFRSDIAAEMALDFTLRAYEEWFDSPREEA